MLWPKKKPYIPKGYVFYHPDGDKGFIIQRDIASTDILEYSDVKTFGGLPQPKIGDEVEDWFVEELRKYAREQV